MGCVNVRGVSLQKVKHDTIDSEGLGFGALSAMDRAQRPGVGAPRRAGPPPRYRTGCAMRAGVLTRCADLVASVLG